ncbi:MAG: MFS transporter [Chlorobiota bacterium]|nr:MAG: MFS transporter [Chlorobiota bacterium]
MKGLNNQKIVFPILVAALGYFVDIYDLILFAVVRSPSLSSLGFKGDDIKVIGENLLNIQMVGMLLGGLIWGIIGDKKGRLTVLFGSIITYSLANLANGFVHDTTTYGLLRFIAGVGLAGELGAGITLVAEIMPKETRGWGTTLIATVGVTGAIVAAIVGSKFDWRTSYFIGGGLGLSLLLLRVGVIESGMFSNVKNTQHERGDFLLIIKDKIKLKKFLYVIFIATPTWYFIGILVTLSPEFGSAMGMLEKPSAPTSVMFAYIGIAIGDLLSGVLSQYFKSRKKAIAIFLGLSFIMLILYFTLGKTSLTAFYSIVLFFGISVGYWAVFVTIATEQFGTNIRATVTTSAPNFVRGLLIPMSLLFKYTRDYFGSLTSIFTIGVIAILISIYSLYHLEETFEKDLDYIEK